MLSSINYFSETETHSIISAYIHTVLHTLELFIFVDLLHHPSERLPLGSLLPLVPFLILSRVQSNVFVYTNVPFGLELIPEPIMMVVKDQAFRLPP